MTTTNSMGLADKDLKDKADTIAKCEAACDSTQDCAVILFHNKDKHCHTLSGKITHDAYVATLKSDSDHETCMRVASSSRDGP